MNSNLELKNLPQDIKYLLSIFLLSMTLGISTGLAYIYITTNMNTSGITERFNGSEVIDNQIPENYPKPIENMILRPFSSAIFFDLSDIFRVILSFRQN